MGGESGRIHGMDGNTVNPLSPTMPPTVPSGLTGGSRRRRNNRRALSKKGRKGKGRKGKSRKSMKGGVGIIETAAVPVGLFALQRFFKGSQRTKKDVRRFGKSFKRTFRRFRR